MRTPRQILIALRQAGPATKLALGGVVLIVAGGAVTAAVASQKDAVATPTITTHPTNPATVTSAKFGFIDSTSGVSFECSLDGAAYASCTSPKTYAGPLAVAAHAFNVRARNAKGVLSAAAGFTWTIAITPPTLTSTPVNPSTSTSATLGFADSQAGLSFECSLDGAAFVACTSPKTYAGTLAQASHTFSVRARNGIGNLSAPATYTWRIDRTPPPAPTITAKPADPTNQAGASFTFTDPESGVSYLCQRDGAAFARMLQPQDVQPGRTGCPHFRSRSRRPGRQHRSGDVVRLDRRPDLAADAQDHVEPVAYDHGPHSNLRLHRYRGRRQLPVSTRQRDVLPVRQPEELLRPEDRRASVRGTGRRPGRQRQHLRVLRVDRAEAGNRLHPER